MVYAHLYEDLQDEYEDLMAASFYSETIGADYTIRVYVSDTPMGDNPESGALKAVKTGKIPHKGYHTVDLDSPVELKHDQYFSIVLTIHNGNKVLVNIAREKAGYEPTINTKSTVAIQPGQSFFRLEGEKWEDLYKPGVDPRTGNLRIKAFTKNKSAPPTPTPEPANIPKTGDSASLDLWLAIILLGTICLTLALRRSR